MKRMLLVGLLLSVCWLAGTDGRAGINVTVSGPGGAGSAVLPDEGGSFALDIPLNRNAVNPIRVTATDAEGQTAAAELSVTQLSLDRIVVSKVTTERLSVARVEELVAEGVIDLIDPENYNVSEFSIVLTIDKEEIPISVPLVFSKAEPEGPGGGEGVPLLWGDDGGGGGGKKEKIPPEIIVFAQEVRPKNPAIKVPPIPGVIIIEGRIKSLKEFFSVRLMLMNTSGIFTLSNVVAEIEFADDGLSCTLPADGICSFGNIMPGTPEAPGQVEKEFIVRGDKIGVHDLNLNFGGVVVGPGISGEDSVPFNGSATADLEVKGPPQFNVTVRHPDRVTAGVPCDLVVDILNAGELTAMYASLEVDVSADAQLVTCTMNEAGEPVCENVREPVIRSLGHIDPGETVSETFTVMPDESGPIGSCMGIADQNISLRVVVGDIGCMVGRRAPQTGAPSGTPTVTVAPGNNAQGISVDSPVVAFFSELMNRTTISTGSNGTFNVYDRNGSLVRGQIRYETNLNARGMAIWQVNDGVLNRWRPGEEYTVHLTQGIRDLQGTALFNEWVSTFKTTTMGMGAVDVTPPELTLSIEPPVNPNWVLPGERVRVNAYAADQGSGVARVELRMKDLDGTNLLYTLVDQKSVFEGDKPPFIFTLDSSNMDLGHTYQLMGTAYDGMANLRNSTISLLVATTAAPPVIDLPISPSNDLLQGIAVVLSPLSISGGVHEVRYYLNDAVAPYKTLRLPPYRAGLSTLDLPLSNHTVRAVAEDGLGQTGEDLYMFNLIENPNMPVVSFPGSVDGEQHLLGELFSVKPLVEDEVGIRSMHVYIASATNLVSTNSGAILIDTTTLGPGLHRMIVVATNNLGVANDPGDGESVLEFSVVEPQPGLPPPAPVVTTISPPSSGRVTIQGTSVANAGISVENRRNGIRADAYANSAGTFSAETVGEAGDVLRLTAYDLSQSPDPSPATEVVVPAPPVLLSIASYPTNTVLGSAGAYVDLVVTGFYQSGSSLNVTGQGTFLSDKPAIASVNSSGRGVGHTRGTATITATVGAKTAYSTVFVDVIALTGIVVNPPAVSLVAMGQTAQLVVTGLYNNGTSLLLGTGNSFVSGTPAVATVNSAGTITAVADGLTEITVYRTKLPAVSVPVQVNTGLDPRPTVQLISPASLAVVAPGELVGVSVRALDPTGGVTRVFLKTSGATVSAEQRPISPALNETTQVFNFRVDALAPLGGIIHVDTWAEDTSGNLSMTSRVDLAVGDMDAPSVSITQPLPGTSYGYGQTITVEAHVTDAGGVTQATCRVSGAFTASQSRSFAVPVRDTNVIFNLVVPYGVPYPDVTLRAQVWDVNGLSALSLPVPVVISDADVTPPATVVTAVSDPGSGETATVAYRVDDGLSDLDYVLLFFRKDGLGTFNLYTDADRGLPTGRVTPQSGDIGTLLFDSTKMGGDGAYEFYSVGVDVHGNRELAPTNILGVVTSDQQRAFSAGTVWVTIGTNATISAGDHSFDDQNLRIVGATMTVDGVHSFHNVELVSGARMTHMETTVDTAYGLDLTTWTLTIDSTSSINVDGRGYLGGKRPGNTLPEGLTLNNQPGSKPRSGGSYGGSGGLYSGGPPNDVYGSLVMPVDLGSGGSADAGENNPGGDGGGRVAVNAVCVVNDGLISAGGAIGSGDQSGSGSGGSVYLVVGSLSGTGWINANGAAHEVGGGGGRIAVHHVDMSTCRDDRIQALGGIGSYRAGGNGTVFLKGVDESNGSLIVDGQGTAFSFSPLPIPPGYVFDDVVIRNHARVVADSPLVVSNVVRIETGSIVTHSRGLDAGLSIVCRRLEIDSTSAIDVSERGYRGGQRDGNASQYGETLGGLPGSYYESGGSYGGLGGSYRGKSFGAAYGHPARPVYLGAGGGADAGNNNPGGNGGGRVRIEASEMVFVEGAIRANGQAGSGDRSGSGAGGSLWVTSSGLRGSGEIVADGAAHEVGGGGGRLCVEYDYVGGAGDDLNGLRNIHAFGGKGSYGWGSSGTVLLKRNDQMYGDLYVDAGHTATAPRWTPLTHLGFGTVTGLSVNTLWTDGKVALLPDGLVGVEINPNTVQDETFVVLSNTETSLTVDVSGGVGLTDVAAIGDEYAAIYRFDNVIFRRGGLLVAGDVLEVSDTVTIDENGMLTHYDATEDFDSRLELVAGTLAISGLGSINVDGRGYPGGLRWSGSTGMTLGHVAGSGLRAGGSCGGLGGAYSTGRPNPAYGSITQPADLGSGGGADTGQNNAGGDGGGVVHVVAGTVELDGAITAHGAIGSGDQSGSGSGGSIWLETGSLSGGGAIAANGAAHEVGGGGGRIAVHYADMQLPSSQIAAVGGQGNYGAGGCGTIFLQQAGQPYGSLIVDGHNQPRVLNRSPLPGGYVFDSIVLRNNAYAVADEGLEAVNRVDLMTNSILTHSRGNEAGLSIVCRRLEIDSTSAIDVSARGYRGGQRDGNVSQYGETLGGLPGSHYDSGGSYGGLGAFYSGTSFGAAYGHPARPVYLGAGGGDDGGSGDPGGNGGGCARIEVSEMVVVNGAIRANGQNGSADRSGSGSGGSIWITTSELRGIGEIVADGAAHEVGGGGGRIFVEHDDVGGTGDDLNGLRNIHALGGKGSYAWGSAGTVLLKRSGQSCGDLYVDAGHTATAPRWTPLTHLGFGTVSGLSPDTLWTDGKVALLPNGLVGVEINPNTAQDETFIVLSNTETSLTVDVTGGVDLTDAASVGDEYAAVYRFDNVVFRRGGLLVAGDLLKVSDTVTIDEFGMLTHYDVTQDFDSRLELSADVLTIAASGSISVDGRGYPGGLRWSGSRGMTFGHIAGSEIRAGGSFGGLGGQSPGKAGHAYGSVGRPSQPGSGGGADVGENSAGGDGGGVVRVVAETIEVDGTITAHGANGTGDQSGSGSGGSIWITTSSLSGSGSIAADGAAYEVGGGGGRILLEYDDYGQPGDDLNTLRNIHAFGGKGSYAWGSAGTVLLRRNGQSYGNLYVDGGHSATAPRWTPLTHLGFGTVAALTVDTLWTDGKVALIPNGLVGLEINPNTSQDETFVVLSNTATSLTVDVSGGIDLTDVAAIGNEYTGVYRFDNVIFRRGGLLVVGDFLKVYDTVTIDENGMLTHYDVTETFDSRLELEAGTLAIEALGSINVDGRGYPGGLRWSGSAGMTLGHVAGSGLRAGGSHGGLGGSYAGAIPNPLYGSVTEPAEPGSGGGADAGQNNAGGDGGGVVHVVAGTVALDGSITARGGNGTGDRSGSGSGGSIWLETGALSGSGTIVASGAAHEVGGGGGRVAVYYVQASSSTGSLSFVSLGGAGSYAAGSIGTVYLDGTYAGPALTAPAPTGFEILGVSLNASNELEVQLSTKTLSSGLQSALTEATGGLADQMDSGVTVEFSESLMEPDWRELGEISIDGGVMRVALPSGADRGFIRVRLREAGVE